MKGLTELGFRRLKLCGAGHKKMIDLKAKLVAIASAVLVLGYWSSAKALTKPIEFAQLLSVREHVYRIKLLKSEAHQYRHDSEDYICGFEYFAEVIDTYRGSRAVEITFGSTTPLRVGQNYLIFLDEVEAGNELSNDRPDIERAIEETRGYGYSASNPVLTDAGQECMARLPSLRSASASEIFEFIVTAPSHAGAEWLRYSPSSRTITFPEAVDSVIVNPRCVSNQIADCPFLESFVLVSWASLKDVLSP